MADRDLQDELIRALADAGYRRSPEWRARGLASPDRVERFARFLARRFYHQRAVHFFKYSRALSRVTGRRPEEVVWSPGFDALLPRAVLGSRETAAAVASLVVAHIGGAPARDRVPYLDDLLRYEEAMMLAEAGPRAPSGERSREPGGAAEGVAEVAEGAALLDLEYDLPQVLPELLGPWAEVPACPRRAVSLLVARSADGRVTVARPGEEAREILRLAREGGSLEEAAARSGIAPDRLRASLRQLVDLGAVRPSTGS